MLGKPRPRAGPERKRGEDTWAGHGVGMRLQRRPLQVPAAWLGLQERPPALGRTTQRCPRPCPRQAWGTAADGWGEEKTGSTLPPTNTHLTYLPALAWPTPLVSVTRLKMQPPPLPSTGSQKAPRFLWSLPRQDRRLLLWWMEKLRPQCSCILLWARIRSLSLLL